MTGAMPVWVEVLFLAFAFGSVACMKAYDKGVNDGKKLGRMFNVEAYLERNQENDR